MPFAPYALLLGSFLTYPECGSILIKFCIGVHEHPCDLHCMLDSTEHVYLLCSSVSPLLALKHDIALKMMVAVTDMKCFIWPEINFLILDYDSNPNTSPGPEVLPKSV